MNEARLSKVIASADTSQSPISDPELSRLKSFVADGQHRLDAINAMTSNLGTTINATIIDTILNNPDLVKDKGSCNSSRRMAACSRDLDILLRYISYALLAGTSQILDQQVLNGLAATYEALKVPLPPFIEAIRSAQKKVLDNMAQENCGSSIIDETNGYFDHVIDALSQKNGNTPNIASQSELAGNRIERQMKDFHLPKYLQHKFEALLNNLKEEFDGSTELAQEWLVAPHPDFGGKTPLSLIQQGKLGVVEDLVEAIASGQPG